MADITLQQAQQMVDAWIKTYGVRYFNELTNMTILTEEVGELARIMARTYGEQSFKESDKHRHLQQYSNAGNQKNGQCIYQSLRHHCPQRFGKRDIIILRQHPATTHLPYPGNDQAGGIRNKDGIHTVASSGESIQRPQRLPPPPPAKYLSKHPEQERKKHPPPVRTMP